MSDLGRLQSEISSIMDGSVSGFVEFEGEGSVVTITPTLENGTKIADYTIDETSGALYTPTYTAGENVTITDGVISAQDTTYTAGENITIEDNVISSTGGGIQYLRPTNGTNVVSNYFSETKKYYQQIRSTSGYEGYTYSINYDFELDANYRIEFDYKNSIGRFNTNYPWRFYVSESQITNYDVGTGTPNLPKDDIYHHLSYDFTASTKFLYLVFAMASVSEGGLNEFQNVTITKIS